MSVPPPGPLAYTGQVAVPFINRTFPPTSDFNKFKVPTVWIDTSAKMAYILVSTDLGTAEWVPIGGVPGEVETITVDGFSPPGTNPVTPNGSQSIIFTAEQAAPGTIPTALDTFSDALNTVKMRLQQTSTASAKNVDLNGISHFDSDYFTNDQGFISILGSALGQTITAQSGGPLSPTAGNWNIFGLGETSTSGAGSTLSILSPRTAKFVVDPTANFGTHTTITAALAAAAAGQTIFIRPGTYTENLTLKAGVNLAAYEADALTPNVTIVGKLTASYTGIVSLSGIRCQTNADNCISVTGASSLLILSNCFISATNNTSISITNGILSLLHCNSDISNTGISLFAMTGGFLVTEFCDFSNTAQSSTQSTCADGTITSIYSNFSSAILVSGTTATINAFASTFGSQTGVIAITQNSTAAIEMNLRNCFVIAPSTAAVSIGAGANLSLCNCTVRAGVANAITGAGTCRAAGIVFEDSAATINTATVITLNTFPLVGKVVQHLSQLVTGLTTTSSAIPSDTSIPQSGEGTEFTTLSITPKYSTSTLKVEFDACVGMDVATDACTFALFRDAQVNALQTRSVSVANNALGFVRISYEAVAGSTASTTFKIRFGPSNGANTANINGTGGVNYFGASNATNFSITEYQP